MEHTNDMKMSCSGGAPSTQTLASQLRCPRAKPQPTEPSILKPKVPNENHHEQWTGGDHPHFHGHLVRFQGVKLCGKDVCSFFLFRTNVDLMKTSGSFHWRGMSKACDLKVWGFQTGSAFSLRSLSIASQIILDAAYFVHCVITRLCFPQAKRDRVHHAQADILYRLDPCIGSPNIA